MTLSIRNHTIFRGPNGWDRSPVIHLIVDASRVHGGAQFTPSLAGWYLELAELVTPGTSLEPVSRAEPENLGALLAEMALNLQRIAGVSVEFSCGGPRFNDPGQDVVVQYRHERVGLHAAKLAVAWLADLFGPAESGFDLVIEFEQFTGGLAANELGVHGRAMADAAHRRGIPLTLVDPRGRVVELGTGRYRKRIFANMTSQTSTIGREIARDKHLTNCYLRAAGLPVPDSAVVRTLPEALAAARSIGYPVAIKPDDLGDSIGVALDRRNDDDLRASFDAAAKAAATSNGLMVVERFVHGHDYRVMIVDDAIVAVSRRLHPQVTGDDAHTIRELIEIENTNPRRGTRTSDIYKKIPVDERVLENLAQMGLSLDAVPTLGKEVVLKQSGHRRDGAIHVDVTEAIHPVNAKLMRTANRVLGLDFAGIDLVTPDISQSLWDVGGAIIEINEGPAFNLHLFPGGGPVRDPGPAIMEMLFPPGAPVRVPLIAVTAHDDSRSISKTVAEFLSFDSQTVGLASGDGVFIDGTHYLGAEGRNPVGPRMLMNNPTVETAVVEIDAVSIVEYGLGFDSCDIALVSSLSGLKTPHGLPIETVLLRALTPDGVAILNASDPGVGSLAAAVDRPVIFFNVGLDDGLGSALIEQGDATVTVRKTSGGTHLAIIRDETQQVLIVIGSSESAENGGALPISLQAAVAAAFGLNIPSETIQHFLESMVSSSLIG